MTKRILIAFFIFALSATIAPSLSQAQNSSISTGETSSLDALALSQGQGKVVDKLSAEFSSFLGDDSRAVVTGLRTGTPFEVTSTTTSSTGTPTTTVTTINPPTGQMGFGNVKITLALAETHLSQYGITQPTPEQLQAALLGGAIMTGSGTSATTTDLQGVLTMRSQGMGWGEISKELGYKLGSVVSGHNAAKHGATVGTTSSTGSGIVNGAGQSVGATEGGIVTGSGRSVGKSWKGASIKSRVNKGIVTGSGRSTIGATSGITTGRGHGYGHTTRGHGHSGRGKGRNK